MEREIEYRTSLKKFVRNAEEYYLWYRDELERFYKLKLDKVFPEMEESIKEWMGHLKEMKNFSEKRLKELRTEMEYLNQGLNPPYCYTTKAFSGI